MLRLESAEELDYEFAVVPKQFFFAFKTAQGEQKKAPLEENASDVTWRF